MAGLLNGRLKWHSGFLVRGSLHTTLKQPCKSTPTIRNARPGGLIFVNIITSSSQELLKSGGPQRNLSPLLRWDSQLIAELLQRHFDQLRTRANLQFAEELPETGLDRTFRNFQPLGDFPIRQSLQNQSQYGPVPVRQFRTGRRARPVHGPEQRRQVLLFQADLALSHLSDGTAQRGGGMVLVQDSRDPRLDQLNRLLVARSGRNHQNLEI